MATTEPEDQRSRAELKELVALTEQETTMVEQIEQHQGRAEHQYSCALIVNA